MRVEIYFSHSFLNEQSSIFKIQGRNEYADIDESTETTASNMYANGWMLKHAIKTSGSAQLEDFNFLLIFEKD